MTADSFSLLELHLLTDEADEHSIQSRDGWDPGRGGAGRVVLVPSR